MNNTILDHVRKYCTFQDGDCMVLLNLGGTIPVKYKEETYNIPGLVQ